METRTDYMISQLKNKVSADRSFTLEKILKAGSNANFTSLPKTVVSEAHSRVKILSRHRPDGASYLASPKRRAGPAALALVQLISCPKICSENG